MSNTHLLDWSYKDLGPTPTKPVKESLERDTNTIGNME